MVFARKAFRVCRAIIRFVVAAATAYCITSAASAQSLVDRGAYLVNSILACGNCHTPRSSTGNPIIQRNLAGGLSITTPAFNATASNITPDRETGIGTWSDEEIKRALVEGVRPNHGRLANTHLAAAMPVSFFKVILPRDLDAIVAYLRSVKPVRSESSAPVYKLPVKRDQYPGANADFAETAMGDPVKRGAYLVAIGHCMECHSPNEKGISDYTKLGKGGRLFSPQLVQGLPKTWKGSVARNITSHPIAGIGAWSDAEIKRAITKGISRDGQRLQPPMAFSYYNRMTDADLDAMVAYLRTVPPLE